MLIGQASVSVSGSQQLAVGIASRDDALQYDINKTSYLFKRLFH
jgi:hypothetical protein